MSNIFWWLVSLTRQYPLRRTTPPSSIALDDISGGFIIVGMSVKLRQVLIVDDEPLTRLGIGHLIESMDGFVVCGEALDTADGLAEVRRKRPDLTILDVAIEGDHGIEFIEQAQEQTKVLVCSLREETIYAERCIQAGASGYVSKRASLDVIRDAMQSVLANQIVLSPRIRQRLLHRMANGGSHVDAGAPELLTDRELEVFEMLGEGRTTQEIADHLSLSPKTVQSYDARIKQKLGLENNNQLIRRAVHYVLQGR